MNSSNILSLESMLATSDATALTSTATYVGIDFGTSTTVVSIASQLNGEKKIKTLPVKLTQILEDGTKYQSEKLPSVIAWYNGKLLVGEGASNLKYTLTKGKNIWFSFKMEIGSFRSPSGPPSTSNRIANHLRSRSPRGFGIISLS